LKDRDGARVREFYTRALTHDPQFAAAWAAIADTWLLSGRFTDADPRSFSRTRVAAEKAIALDPELADGHAVLAAVYSDYQWRWQDADREYRRALELNPNHACAYLVRRTVDLPTRL
jgi:serine/threonine-protein kinase